MSGFDDFSVNDLSALYADLEAMFSLTDATRATSGPTAHLATGGSARRVEVQVAGEYVILAAGRYGTYALDIADTLRALALLADSSCVVELSEFDGARSLRLEREGDDLRVWLNAGMLTASAHAFFSAFARAGLGVAV